MPNIPSAPARGPATNGPEPHAEQSTRRAVADLFQSFGPCFLGLCCCNIWIGWMNGAHALRPDQLWDTLCAATMIAVLSVAIWWGARHAGGIRTTYPADWPIALAMAAFTLPAAGIPTEDPTASLVMATMATEIGMAWFYVRWGVFLSRLNLRSTVGCIFIAHVVGCTAKLALDYVPVGAAAVPMVLLPILSAAALSCAGRRLDQAEGRDGGSSSCPPPAGPSTIWCAGTRGAWGPFWKVAIFVLCYRLIFQLAPAQRSIEGSLSLSTVCCLAEIAVALSIVYMMFVRSGSFTFQQVWSIFLLLIGAALLCSMAEAPGVIFVGTSMRAAAGSLLVMFTWLVFADISHHSTLHPFVIFGIARISYELPRLVTEGLELSGLASATNDPFSTGLLFFALLVFAILFFDWRDPTLSLIFSDFQNHSRTATPDQAVDACREAARSHGLTQREEEVLLYLCQGRTRAYIAETLYLSENTVRGHTQRIYGKLGVHNKTELQRKLGV